MGGQVRAGQRDFPGGPVVKNLLCNAGDIGLIPGQGTKIPHAPICFLWKVCSIFSSESLALVTSLVSGSTDSKTDLVFTL